MSKVIVLRGLPRTGKSCLASTIASFLEKKLGQTVFVVFGEYGVSDDDRVECLREFMRIINHVRGKDFAIIVDRTNISSSEYSPYMEVALAYGVKSELWTISVTPEQVETCVYRNACEIPESTIRDMAARMESESIPAWYTHKIIPMGGDMSLLYSPRGNGVSLVELIGG